MTTSEPLDGDNVDVQKGRTAPDFTLPALIYQDSLFIEQVHLADWRGKTVLLVFSPHRSPFGRMIEIRSFLAVYQEFVRRRVVVFIVSTAPQIVLERVAATYRLPFALLVDSTTEVSRRYGAYKDKSFFGRKYRGIERTTFLLDAEGVVRNVWHPTRVQGHTREVLATLDAYSSVSGETPL